MPPKTIPPHIRAARIKAARTAKGWSQGDLATRMKITKQAVSGIESGRHVVGLDWLIRCATALEISPAELDESLA